MLPSELLLFRYNGEELVPKRLKTDKTMLETRARKHLCKHLFVCFTICLGRALSQSVQIQLPSFG